MFPVLIFISGFLLYSQTLTYNYVLDDVLVITGNKFTKKGIAGIPDIVTSDLFIGAYGEALSLSGGRYRPLSMTTFAIEYELFGLNPLVGHLVNTLLYALTCLLIYLFLLRTTGVLFIAASASLLFAAHPVHTEVVANIKSRDEIFSLLFILPVLMNCHKLSLKNILLNSLLFFLALLSKENAITALAVIPLTLWLYRESSLSRIIFLTIPYAVMALIYLALRAAFAGMVGDRETADIMDNPFINASVTEKISTLILIAGYYIKLLFIPWPLSYDYSYNEIPLAGWTGWKVWASLLTFTLSITFSLKMITRHFSTVKSGAVPQTKSQVPSPKFQVPNSKSQVPGKIAQPMVASIIKDKDKKVAKNLKRHLSPRFYSPGKTDITVTFGIMFYIITYSIVSNVVFNIGTNLGERFAYTPSLGFCIAMAGLLAKILRVDPQSSFRVSLSWIAGLIIVPGIFSVLTIKRNPVWKSNFTLYSTDVNHAPNSARTHLYYGIELIGRHEKEKDVRMIREAIEEIKRSAEICPSFHHAWYNLGIAYQSANAHDSAIAAFNRVLKLQPLHIKSHYCLGISYGKGKGDLDRAVYYFEKAWSFQYRDAEIFDNLGIAYAMKGETQKAIGIFNEGLKKFPSHASLYLNLATVYANNGDMKTAEPLFQKAYALDPALKKTAGK
ncbi:MAG: tetratricopeptide repeat protein [Bacteroidetes bacterium]|nr:tetratricopeptide repeat protein [Bacteroidota bacterium]